jgi:hypothetical protein
MRRASTFTPATLGSVTRAEIIRIIVWCKDRRHQVEPNPAPLWCRDGGYRLGGTAQVLKMRSPQC